LAEHDEILDAIDARDPERAELAARNHMKAALEIRIQMTTAARVDDEYP
jgi:DNA-binding FadR family transcriptional regulator